jgi:replicative DNA helicase
MSDDFKEYENTFNEEKKKDDSLLNNYLCSKLGKNVIKDLKLGYCNKKNSLVIPVEYLDSASEGVSKNGFIFRNLRLDSTKEDSSIFCDKTIGDPVRNAENEDLLVVADVLDLYILRDKGTPILINDHKEEFKNYTSYKPNEFSIVLPGEELSDFQKKRLNELIPRSIVFIKTNEPRSKALLNSLKQFCNKELIKLAIVEFENIWEVRKEGSKERVRRAIEKIALLDHTARNSEDLLSWLATQPPALKTGYESLDKSIRIPVGAMTIIAGRPKHGKTTFLYNLMLKMAESGLYTDKKFYFFSFEENGNRIKQKMLSRILQANGASATSLANKHSLKDVRTGEDLIQRYALKRQENPGYLIHEIEDATKKLDTLLTQIAVVNDSLTVEELDKMIRKLNEREAIGAIFIDYMQRIRTDKERSSIRENMNHVSDVLKWCAVNTGLSLIVGAQISRKADEKGRPAQNDIKESGNLEEDANLVLCVYNETQASLDQGNNDSPKNISIQKDHVIIVYTLNSRDSEPSETKFVMNNRLFRIPKPGEV